MTWEPFALPSFILLMGLVFGSLNPNFYSWTNLTNVARQSSVLALLSIGQTFAIVSGGIDLSVGSLLAIVSVLGSMQPVGFGLVPGIVGGIAVATLAGAVSGTLIARTGSRPSSSRSACSRWRAAPPSRSPAVCRWSGCRPRSR